MQIKGTSALVTGGASGLGAATVRRLHEAGAHVLIVDRKADAGQALAAELGDRVGFAEADVTEEASMAAAFDQAVSAHGGLHILVNCAGVGMAQKIVGRNGIHSLDVFEFVIKVNVLGVFNAMRLGAERMQKNSPNDSGERGVIINTASIAAYDGQIGQIAYSASKGGIVAMTLPAARELARDGIRVMAIAPGIFDTPLLAGLPADARKSLGDQVPFPSRLGDPSEYAQLAAHIIENQMLNGETIRLDGSLRMAPR